MKIMSKGFKETKNLKRIMDLLEMADGNDDEIVGFIYETKDYSKFKRMPGNRDVCHAKDIIRSIERVGQLNCPINVNEKYEVADGQNRITAFEEMELPVRYYVTPGMGIEECQALNTGQKNWNDEDYVKSNAEKGVRAYIDLQMAKDKYKNLNYELLIMVSYKSTQNHHGSTLIKSGSLEYHAPTYAEEKVLDFLNDARPYFTKTAFVTSDAMRTLALLGVRGLIDLSRMRVQLEKYATAKEFQYKPYETIYGLQDLYNYNRKNVAYFADKYKETAQNNGK